MADSYRNNTALLREEFKKRGLSSVCIKTYGCQQNVNDSEKIRGVMRDLGCVFADLPEEADIIIFNTCAVRENAEDRVFGHVGALKKTKEEHPQKMLLLGGCMVQQPHIADKIKESFPYVDILFNTNALDKLPELFLRRMQEEKRVFEITPDSYDIDESIPIERNGGYRALLPIMYGCDNFCSFCVVPHVRGRERSRGSAEILKEFETLVAGGYKDIMLLGQNVNSYGKGLKENINFSNLLRMLNDVEGDFTIRFMTSHPKDATIELFDTIADCKKISRNIHLPVQSGSNRILKEMNRRYTKEQYLSLIDEARARIDGVTFTSDIIIGFPGETKEDYLETVDLIERVRFYSLFTFIYSKRVGTKAAEMQDDTDHKTKAERLIALTEVQDRISEEYDEKLVGATVRGIATEEIWDGTFEVRLDNNSIVVAEGRAAVGEYCWVKITELIKRRLYGEIV